MTDTIPTRESLDEAARAAGWRDWNDVAVSVPSQKSVFAHARTLDALHKREPVDPDVEAVKRILSAWYGEPSEWMLGHCERAQRALAAYKQEKA